MILICSNGLSDSIPLGFLNKERKAEEVSINHNEELDNSGHKDGIKDNESRKAKGL